MRYFLIILPLQTDINVVHYKYPEWLTDEMKTKITNLSNTTPADSFVDVVIETDLQNEIDLILENGGKELTQEQFNAWKMAKEIVLETLSQENTNEPTI